MEAAQAQLMAHYPADTPVAICFRVGWPDEKIWVVPLSQMAEMSEAQKLVRTTLYMISPALAGRAGQRADDTDAAVRSRLYNPTHTHLFRPSERSQPASKNVNLAEELNKEQERAKR